MAHWCIHHDLILDELDKLTEVLGTRLHDFSQKTCTQFDTRKLQREYNAHIWREAEQADCASSQPKTSMEPQNVSVALLHIEDPQQGVGLMSTEEWVLIRWTNMARNLTTTAGLTQARNQGWWSKTLNINTYKFHLYSDHARTIQVYGTMDSYLTELVRILEQMMANTCSKPIFI